jgi:hypothetical protein
MAVGIQCVTTRHPLSAKVDINRNAALKAVTPSLLQHSCYETAEHATPHDFSVPGRGSSRPHRHWTPSSSLSGAKATEACSYTLTPLCLHDVKLTRVGTAVQRVCLEMGCRHSSSG